MATTIDYIEFVCEQLQGLKDELRYKKMFGEYMIYLNDKPIFIVCNNTVFVKIIAATEELISESSKGSPYKGAKEHYILDIEDRDLTQKVALAVEAVTPVPKPRRR